MMRHFVWAHFVSHENFELVINIEQKSNVGKINNAYKKTCRFTFRAESHSQCGHEKTPQEKEAIEKKQV